MMNVLLSLTSRYGYSGAQHLGEIAGWILFFGFIVFALSCFKK